MRPRSLRARAGSFFICSSLRTGRILRKTGFASGASFKKLTLATKTISGWTSDVFCNIIWWGYLETACQLSRNLAYGKCPNGKTITDCEPCLRTSLTHEVRARRESSFREPLYVLEDAQVSISRVCSDLVSPDHLSDVVLSGREGVRL